MNKLVGVVGTAGVGKTTVCDDSRSIGCEFIKTDVSGIYKRMGLDPKVRMNFDTRMIVQEEILSYHKQLWIQECVRGGPVVGGRMLQSEPRMLVTDRTPLCFMTFTLAEISGYGELTADQNKALKSYLDRCWEAMEMFKGIMWLGKSFEAPEDTSGKIRATTSYGYSQHYDWLLLGLMTNLRHTGVETLYCDKSDRDLRASLLACLASLEQKRRP